MATAIMATTTTMSAITTRSSAMTDRGATDGPASGRPPGGPRIGPEAAAAIAALTARRAKTAANHPAGQDGPARAYDADRAGRRSAATAGPRRRASAATGGRILALGMSLGASLGLVGVMANAARSDTGGQVTAPAPSTTAAPIVVHVVLPDGRTATAVARQSAVADPPAPPVVRPAPRSARPVTTTRAS
jgi:hypothetical protein